MFSRLTMLCNVALILWVLLRGGTGALGGDELVVTLESDKDKFNNVWILGDGKRRLRLALPKPLHVHDLSWTDDCRRMAFLGAVQLDEPVALFVRDTELRCLGQVGANARPRWCLGGTAILMFDSPLRSSVTLVYPDTGKRAPVAWTGSVPNAQSRGVDIQVARDGTRFAAILRTAAGDEVWVAELGEAVPKAAVERRTVMKDQTLGDLQWIDSGTLGFSLRRKRGGPRELVFLDTRTGASSTWWISPRTRHRVDLLRVSPDRSRVAVVERRRGSDVVSVYAGSSRSRRKVAEFVDRVSVAELLWKPAPIGATQVCGASDFK